MTMTDDGTTQGPTPDRGADPQVVPRYAGLSTFARLPRLEDVEQAAIGVLGVPFDSGVSFRPGARFGPSAIREASRLLRPFNPALDVYPFDLCQVVDAGDVGCNPFAIDDAIDQIERHTTELIERGLSLVTVGGDHTISLPLLRSVSRAHGPVALVHFDAHLDTWDVYFGSRYTHGSPFRRAFEEGLLDVSALTHVGTRGSLYDREDLDSDKAIGFGIHTAPAVHYAGPRDTVEALRERIGDRPVYLSVDVDVLDPAFAPGTGTPEAGGLTSLELLEIIRGLSGLNVVAADVVEVSPPFDHASITSVVASHLAYEFISLIAINRAGHV